jgi:hypothetical protein
MELRLILAAADRVADDLPALVSDHEQLVAMFEAGRLRKAAAALEDHLLRGEAVALAAAIEVVDVNAPFSDVEGIVAANIFHRAALLGDFRPNYPPPRTAVLLVNGHPRQEAAVEDFDSTRIISLVDSTLTEAGERLEPGDKIIAGSLTPPVEVSPDDLVGLQLDNLGMVQLVFKP